MACRYIGTVVLWRLATFGNVFWQDGISRAATTLILYSELCTYGTYRFTAYGWSQFLQRPCHQILEAVINKACRNSVCAKCHWMNYDAGQLLCERDLTGWCLYNYSLCQRRQREGVHSQLSSKLLCTLWGGGDDQDSLMFFNWLYTSCFQGCEAIHPSCSEPELLY